jgi:hypothetical protein
MTMLLSDEQLLSFRQAWAWVVSDRVAEFDDVLHRPISATSSVQAHTRVLIEKWETIKPHEPLCVGLGYFKEMLSSLHDEGEDVEKIYGWTRSLSEYLQDVNAQRAVQIWRETFERFVQGRCGPAGHIDDDVLDQLVEIFVRDAYRPWLDFCVRVAASEPEWLSGRGRRTEFDELLWNEFFVEYEVDPGHIASVGYGQVRIREWWRVVRASLGDEQIAQLRREQIDNTKECAQSEIPSWKIDGSIAETMVCGGFPPFGTLRL